MPGRAARNLPGRATWPGLLQHYDTTAGKTPQPFSKRQPKPGSRRCGSLTSEPSETAYGPKLEIKWTCAELWQRHSTTRKENGQTARAGKTNGHDFHDRLALPTNLPQEKEHAAQRLALPALGRVAGRRPNEKKTEARKLLEKHADSPASGARFVRCGEFISTRPLNILLEALADVPEKDLPFRELRAARFLRRTVTTALNN